MAERALDRQMSDVFGPPDAAFGAPMCSFMCCAALLSMSVVASKYMKLKEKNTRIGRLAVLANRLTKVAQVAPSRDLVSQGNFAAGPHGRRR